MTPALHRDVWPHLLRAMHWQPIVVAAAVAAAFARLGKPSPEVRVTLVAVTLAIGLSFVLDDAAATTLAPSPTTLGRRRAVRVAIAVSLTAATWVPLLHQLSSSTHMSTHPGPASLELATLTAVALAIAAIACGPDGNRPGGAAAPPLLLALLVVAVGLPARFAFFPVGAHERRWALAGLLALATLLGASRDRAAPALLR
jgi:hypothetical protein